MTGNSISLPVSGAANGASGMDLSGLADGSVIGGSGAAANTINMSGGSGATIGVVVQYAVPGADIRVAGNAITAGTGGTGIYLYYDVDPVHPVLLQNNAISGSGAGTGILASDDGELFGDTPDSGITYATLQGNTISGFATGVVLQSAGANPVAVTIGGSGSGASNSITAAAGGTGVLVQGAHASATIEDNTGSIYGNAVGINVEGGSATISGNDIYGNTTGIKVGSGATAAVSGNTFQNSAGTATANATDLLVASGAASVMLGGNTFAATTTYIDNASALPIDAINETFGAVGPSDPSLTDLYSVENKITDAIDQSGLGFVRTRTGEVYVAHSSEDIALGGSAGAIQRGVSAANTGELGNVPADGDTVNVQAGVYVGELDIEQPLTLRGAQAGVDPTKTLSAPADQTIIEPDASNPNPFDPSSIVLVYVGSDDVAINGVTVDGDNPTLASDSHTVTFNGAAIDAAYGIAAWSGSGDITLTNNIVRNTTYSGIDLENYGYDYASSNNTVSQNLIQNLGGGGYGYGIGVLLSWNFYADVGNNTIEDARVGVQTGPTYLANPGGAGTASISQNQITHTASGCSITTSTPTPRHSPSMTTRSRRPSIRIRMPHPGGRAS